MAVPALMAPFAALADPRVARSRVHVFWEILGIGLLATLCGGQGWDDMHLWGAIRQGWLREELGFELAHGVPSADTFRRMFCRLDPKALSGCLQAWTQTLAEMVTGRIVSIDGKVLRGSFDAGLKQPALCAVRAWAGEARLVLGMEPVRQAPPVPPAGTAADASGDAAQQDAAQAQAPPQQDCEMAALRRLMGTLDLRGALVTADALHTQRDTAEQIIRQQADYLLPLKPNQPGLLADATALFSYVCEEANPARAREWAQDCPGRTLSHASDTDKGHGRIEIRQTSVLRLAEEDPDWSEVQAAWAGLRAFVRVVRSRQNVRTGQKSQETVYYISSSAKHAQALGAAARNHWQAENCLHYVLDVTFGEDASRVRRNHGPANLAALRDLALNLHRRLPQAKGSMRARMKQASWSADYLLQLIA